MEKIRTQLIELAVQQDIPSSRVAEAIKVLSGLEEKKSDRTENFLSVRDAQVYLGGISRAHLWKLRKQGFIKTYRAGGRILFKKTDIDSFICQESFKTTGRQV